MKIKVLIVVFELCLSLSHAHPREETGKSISEVLEVLSCEIVINSAKQFLNKSVNLNESNEEIDRFESEARNYTEKCNHNIAKSAKEKLDAANIVR